MTTRQNNNRRGIERFDLQVPGLIHKKEDGADEIKLYTRDISSNGAFFLTENPLQTDTDLKMTFYLPVGQSLQSKLDTMGTVIRSESDGMAVQFTSKYRISEVPETALVS